MDYKKFQGRRALIAGMKEVTAKKIVDYERRLKSHLTSEEKAMFGELQKHTFNEGSWYRPMHNVVVTAAMIAICNAESLDRKVLVTTAMLHDIGNSFMKVKEGSGADWESEDKRIAHRITGVEETRKIMERLVGKNKIAYSPRHIEAVCDLIMTHDDPYLGTPLPTELEKQHRDADRVFVPSILSWYKDFLNYRDDKKDGYKMDMSPQQFLEQRLAFFYETPFENPIEVLHPLKSEKAIYNEGGRCEPMYTASGKAIVDHILVTRAAEFDADTFSLSKDGFLEFFSEGLDRETYHIFRMLET